MNSDEYIFPNLALTPIPSSPESLKDVSGEKFVKLTQKTTDVIRKNYKSTTPTKYDNNNTTNPQNNDKVTYDRHTGIKTKNGELVDPDVKATDTFPKEKTFDYDYPHN